MTSHSTDPISGQDLLPLLRSPLAPPLLPEVREVRLGRLSISREESWVSSNRVTGPVTIEVLKGGEGGR